jgi:hypothetical protein
MGCHYTAFVFDERFRNPARTLLDLSAECSSQAQFAPIGATIPQIIARPGWLLPGLSFAVSLVSG